MISLYQSCRWEDGVSTSWRPLTCWRQQSRTVWNQFSCSSFPKQLCIVHKSLSSCVLINEGLIGVQNALLAKFSISSGVLDRPITHVLHLPSFSNDEVTQWLPLFKVHPLCPTMSSFCHITALPVMPNLREIENGQNNRFIMRGMLCDLRPGLAWRRELEWSLMKTLAYGVALRHPTRASTPSTATN